MEEKMDSGKNKFGDFMAIGPGVITVSLYDKFLFDEEFMLRVREFVDKARHMLMPENGFIVYSSVAGPHDAFRALELDLDVIFQKLQRKRGEAESREDMVDRMKEVVAKELVEKMAVFLYVLMERHLTVGDVNYIVDSITAGEMDFPDEVLYRKAESLAIMIGRGEYLVNETRAEVTLPMPGEVEGNDAALYEDIPCGECGTKKAVILFEEDDGAIVYQCEHCGHQWQEDVKG